MNTLTKIGFTHTKNVANLIRLSSSSCTIDDRWKIAIKSGEKAVGYPTSFMNLKWLLTDEISNIASYVSRLIGSKHPMVNVSRDLLQQNDTAKWGLIVLLISKAVGLKPGGRYNDLDRITGLRHCQITLAEITEMIKTGYRMHTTMLNINQKDENYNTLHFGNKIALLAGDYLYSKSFKELSLLNNNDLNEIITTSLRDMSQAEFLEQRDEYDRPVPNKPTQKDCKDEMFNAHTDPHGADNYPITPREEWLLRTVLGGVTLLAKSCKGAMILGGHAEETQELGCILGRNIGLAWQCMQEVKPFIYDTKLPFSLTSAPVLFQLQDDPEMFKLFEGPNPKYSEIRERVIQGEGIVEALDLLKRLTYEAMNILNYFPNNGSQYALCQMVNALRIR